MKNKLIVLSMDAMVGEDIEYLKTKPNFQTLFAHASGAQKAQTIYPSITYPAHISMSTGCRAGKHGIFNNVHFMSDKPYSDWYLYHSDTKAEDIFTAAKRVGATTASVYWPITGNHKDIDYLVDEYFFGPYDSITDEQVLASYRELGASDETLEAVKDNLGRIPYQYKHKVGRLNLDQTFDNFIMGTMCSLVRRYQPDVLYGHNCILDSLRHKYGIFNEYVTWGLDMFDMWLGELIKVTKDAGIFENTNFVLCSDHGQMDFARRLKINTLLARGGFLELDGQGKLKSWKAYGQSNGMSCYIMVKDTADEKAVYDFLKARLDDGVYGYEAIFTREEVKEMYGLDGAFTFMLESDGYTSFSDASSEPIVAPADYSDYRLGKATHGYRPEKGPQPVLRCAGPDFKQDVILPMCYTIDEAPTFAKLLGSSLPEADGRVLDEILA